MHLTYCNPNPFKMSCLTRGGTIPGDNMDVLVKPERVERGEREVVVVVHDESIFSSNDGTSMVWVRADEFPIMPKGKGRICMVSDFLTTHGIFFKYILVYVIFFCIFFYV